MKTIVEAAVLRDEVEEKFNVHMHIHDQCGSGLWFHLDEPSEEIQDYLQEYCDRHGWTLEVLRQGERFGIY